MRKRSLLPHVALFLPAVLVDIATLGGTVNDGYFRNGRCSYTTRLLRDAVRVATEKKEVKL